MPALPLPLPYRSGLLAALIKPMVKAGSWQKELGVLQVIVDDVPDYTFHFNGNSRIAGALADL